MGEASLIAAPITLARTRLQQCSIIPIMNADTSKHSTAKLAEDNGSRSGLPLVVGGSGTRVEDLQDLESMNLMAVAKVDSEGFTVDQDCDHTQVGLLAC